jgi:tRNA (cytidine/uridine-2'-O-)-methyltransferase
MSSWKSFVDAAAAHNRFSSPIFGVFLKFIIEHIKGMVQRDNNNKVNFDSPDFGPRLHADPLCRVVLVEPLIPENTGNVSRTCVGTESELHLVGPMGFEINEKRVRRAGLDYWPHLAWTQHANYPDWRGKVQDPSRIFFIETSGKKSIFEADFKRGDWLVFGKETSGLDDSIIQAEHDAFAWNIPMPGPTRSFNLSNAVAVTVFEMMRQILYRK